MKPDINRTRHGPIPYAGGQIQIKHYNAEAPSGLPLILPVTLLCNTDDDQRKANITANSRRADLRWLRQFPAHDRTAIICGSGPSIEGELGRIKELAMGGEVFALNGAARWLNRNGIKPDYQVMLDAKPSMAGLLDDAQEHVLASQCDPSVFDACRGNITLMHIMWHGLDECLPFYPDSYAVVGSASSVGPVACFLAYTLGYRRLELFGFDSSHQTAKRSHVVPQPINDGEPCAWVTFGGKDYFASLVMKQQAEQFPAVAQALHDLSCTIAVHGDGLLPAVYNTPFEALTEREKYHRMWAVPGYRDVSPGELAAATFIEKVKPDGLVIDFGCGTGRGGLAIAQAGHDVVLVDFASNCRDPEAMALPFVEADLSEPCPLRASYGYCTDVMEHIPPADVAAVVRNIMDASGTVFFQISTVPDAFGAVINQRLHLTVKPHEWWAGLFIRLGFAVTWQADHGTQSQFVIKGV
jgi:hypothetical protein